MGIIYMKKTEERNNIIYKVFFEGRMVRLIWENANGDTVTNTVERYIYDRNISSGKWKIVK